MRTEKGAAGLLIMAETVLLAAVVILGVMKGLGPDSQGEGTAPVVNGTENGTETWTAGETEEPQEEAAAGTEGAASSETSMAFLTTEGFSDGVTEQLSAMMTEEKVAQMFLVSPETLTGNELVTIAGEGTRSALAAYPVGGLVYTEDNFQGRQQFTAMLSGAQQYSMEQSGNGLFLAVETGTANSTEENGTGEDGRLVFSALYDTDALTEIMASGGTGEGQEDVYTAVLYPVEQPDGSILFLVVSGKPDADLTGDEQLLCMLSAQVMSGIRETFGYQGLIVTSDLSDEAVTESCPDGEAAVLAAVAGADMLYVTGDFTAAYEAVLAAVEDGRISAARLDNAVGHILTQKEEMAALQEDGSAAESDTAETASSGQNSAAGSAEAGSTTDAAANTAGTGDTADTSATADSGSASGTASTADSGSTSGTASTADSGSTSGTASMADSGSTSGISTVSDNTGTTGSESTSSVSDAVSMTDSAQSGTVDKSDSESVSDIVDTTDGGQNDAGTTTDSGQNDAETTTDTGQNNAETTTDSGQDDAGDESDRAEDAGT